MNIFPPRTPAILRPLALGAVLSLLGGCTSARAQNSMRVEAEANPPSNDVQILDLPDASGGKAVSIPRDWQPLLIAPVPKEGDAFTVWVRYKDAPVLVKADLDGGQKDLQWLWDKPATLTWKKAGRFTREQIGKNLVVIRGGDGGQGPVVDCLVFATDDAYDPNTAPAPNVPAAPAPGAPAPGANAPADNAPAANNGAPNINDAAALTLGLKKRPDGELIEAEANPPGGAQVVEAAGASGGKAVKASGDWQPVFVANLPAGDSWRVWVRSKGGPFAVKAQADGKGVDRWYWDKPADWKWTETDVFTRDELGGKQLTIGRDAGGDKPDTVQIDAVVLAPEKRRELPAVAPDPNAPPQKIAASVDWNQKVGTVPALMWGINENEISKPTDAASPKFQNALGELKTPLIRIHNADLVNRWTSAQTRDWDVEKIKAGFAASKGYGNAKLMININQWPAWMSQSDVLEPDKVADFAALTGRLVKIMRDDVKQPVAYWELTNELESKYENAGKLDELWKLYSALGAAVKKADPGAKIGGAAFTWGNYKWVQSFLSSKPDVDFISWHNYGTGDLFETNAKIYEAAGAAFPDISKSVTKTIAQSGQKVPETFLTEFNVKYTWDPYERRQQNSVGAVFLASVVRHVSLAGISGATLWQERGNAYGSLINADDKIFPAYYLYGWGPKYLTGAIAGATSGDETQLEIMPVISKGGGKAVLLLNKTDHTLQVGAASALLPGVKGAQQINAEGYQAKVSSGDLSLPGYSLTLLTN